MPPTPPTPPDSTPADSPGNPGNPGNLGYQTAPAAGTEPASATPPPAARPAAGAEGHNAFSADFLLRLDRLPEPDGAHEAGTAGPWVVTPVPYRGAPRFALLREWESIAAGDVPFAIFRRRETALLAAAVLPATGREPLFRLQVEADGDGFALRTDPDPATVAWRDVAPAQAAAARHSAPSPAPASAQRTPASTHPPEDLDAGGITGHLRDFDEDFAAALNTVVMLARSPTALALLIEAAGPVCIEQAGRILSQRLR
jgi:hypothetical protein